MLVACEFLFLVLILSVVSIRVFLWNVGENVFLFGSMEKAAYERRLDFRRGLFRPSKLRTPKGGRRQHTRDEGRPKERNKIGRESWKERVETAVVAVSCKTKINKKKNK